MNNAASKRQGRAASTVLGAANLAFGQENSQGTAYDKMVCTWGYDLLYPCVIIHWNTEYMHIYIVYRYVNICLQNGRWSRWGY